jgi:eukaryotic-like serine/threonine-protein kinase
MARAWIKHAGCNFQVGIFMSDSDDGDHKPQTLAESIRRKMEAVKNAPVVAPLTTIKEAGGERLHTGAAVVAVNPDNGLLQIASDELEVGSILGAYSVSKLIHSGNTAKIFEAEHSLLNRKLAVKILRSEHNLDTYMVKRLQEEARALSVLKSDHVVDVHDFAIAVTGHPYFILELVHAPSLQELLSSQGPPPEAVSMQIIEQVGEAFSDAHKNGIKYANLKPAHVLIEKSSEKEVCVKLVDFFASYREQGLPPAKPSLDVAPYMSPEQFSGQAAQVQSDIYSLACLAFELLTGTPPFLEKSLEDYSQAHLTKSPRKTDGALLSEEVHKVLLKAMDKDPARRHETVLEFVTALKNASVCSP